jgi:YHS domain-containing protein
MKFFHYLCVVVGFLVCPVLVAAQVSDSHAPVAKASLKQVQTAKVCMVNDALFADDQIPVVVQGKTYYGCCHMCKERLENDSAMRKAVDPISGHTVDKAKAVIGADASGQVFYFENRLNFEKFSG